MQSVRERCLIELITRETISFVEFSLMRALNDELLSIF